MRPLPGGLLLIVGAFGYLASVVFNAAAHQRGQIIAIGDTLTPISHAPASSRLVS